MKVRVDEELAEDCKCELKVLAIKNSLAKGVLRVTVLETRTGIILEGIEIRQIEDDLNSHEGDLQVHFSNYDDFAVVGNHRRCGWLGTTTGEHGPEFGNLSVDTEPLLFKTFDGSSQDFRCEGFRHVNQSNSIDVVAS